MSVFGILHSPRTAPYTTVSLDSFFRFTTLTQDDEVWVVDSCGDFSSQDPGIRVAPAVGRTRARQLNDILRRAAQKHTSAFCLDDALLFTAGWRDRLMEVGTSIAAPLHHRNVTGLRLGPLAIPADLDLDFYQTNRTAIDAFAQSGDAWFGKTGPLKVWLPPMSCFRVSAEAVARLGPMDAELSSGGEVVDYVLRAHLQRIDCLLCPGSFVFRLGGQDAGWQQNGEEAARAFTSRWGGALAERLLFKDFVGSDGIAGARDVIHQDLRAAQRPEPGTVSSSTEFPAPDPRDPRQRYLALLKLSLSNVIYGDAGWLNAQEQTAYNPQVREMGADWPMSAHTMIGLKRLDNLQFCVEDALRRGVPGDVIETGVWRGGATILMRGILKAHGISDRTVWVADSFQGLPEGDTTKYPLDSTPYHEWRQLAIPLEDVQSNFQKYDLLDSQVQFLKGWFKDTLPHAPIERLAVARLDGDMYESTMDGLVNLYPKVSPGGFVIIDDYRNIEACRQAVTDYRAGHHVTDEIHFIDWGGVYWRKS